MKNNHQHNLDYYAYVSEIRNWNSTWKAAFSLGAVLIVLLANSIWVSLFTVFYMCCLTVLVGKVHVHDYIRLLMIPSVFILLSGIAISLQIGGRKEDSVSLWANFTLYFTWFHTSICITRQGMEMAIRLMLKALGAVSAFYVLTLSTPMGEILMVLKKLRVPSLIIELMYLMYRYIFLLSDMNRKQRDTTISRLGYHSYKASIRSFSGGLANLFVMSLKRGTECYDAMESRGYDGELHILEEKQPVRKEQVSYQLLYVVLTLLLIRMT